MPANTPTAEKPALILPAPHPGQMRVWQEMRRFNFLAAGRRWRKTTFAMAWLIEQTLEQGGDFLWGAPTFKQVRVGWDEMRFACSEIADFEFNESRMTILFPRDPQFSGRAKGHFVSLDEPDNARGLTAARVVLDEAADIPQRAWYQVIRPMLMDTNGQALLTGSPKGRNWFHTEWTRAEDRPDAKAWQIPTVGAVIADGRLLRQPHPYENPHVPWPEIEQMFDTLPERVFRQEILAEFLDDAGGVFRGVRECIGGALESAPPNWAQRYVIGVDLAKYQDFTVCAVMDLAEKRIVAFDRYNKADWGLQKARIEQLAKHWNNAIVWLDATGVGDPIYDDLLRAGVHVLPYKLTNATKAALINNAVLLIEQRQVRFPEIPVLVNELVSYEYSRTLAGTLTMNAPEGMHDDAVIAFALSCWPLVHGGGGVRMSDSQMDRLRAPDSLRTEIGGINIMRREF